ncbi:MAG: RNA polymerase sigma factor [Bacillota bacterium]
MSENERLLVKHSKSGDIESFEILIASYEKKAYNIALRIMGNEEDAKDMTQEALVRIYKSISNFKEQSAFSTWMYRIVTNVCLDEIRKRKNGRAISIDGGLETEDGEIKLELRSDEATPEEQYQRKEDKQVILNAINELTEEYKSVIVLRDVQGFSYEEISGILSCSIGTVKSRINRARNLLKDKLKTRLELSKAYNV